jgi:hypothetical protein
MGCRGFLAATCAGSGPSCYPSVRVRQRRAPGIPLPATCGCVTPRRTRQGRPAQGRPVPSAALERDYVWATQAAPTAADKIEVYAAAVATILPRTAPIFVAIREAGVKDPQCADLYAEITGRRAANMRLFVAELRATGQMREDLSDSDAADIVWSMNAAEYYLLLVNERGWTPARFGTHLADTWRRVLLAIPYPAPYPATP